MYALEITFSDGVSQSEMMFVRRPQALIGATEYAHVVVDDMKELEYQLRVYRGLGRNFTVRPIGLREGASVPAVRSDPAPAPLRGVSRIPADLGKSG